MLSVFSSTLILFISPFLTPQLLVAALPSAGWCCGCSLLCALLALSSRTAATWTPPRASERQGVARRWCFAVAGAWSAQRCGGTLVCCCLAKKFVLIQASFLERLEIQALGMHLFLPSKKHHSPPGIIEIESLVQWWDHFQKPAGHLGWGTTQYPLDCRVLHLLHKKGIPASQHSR